MPTQAYKKSTLIYPVFAPDRGMNTLLQEPFIDDRETGYSRNIAYGDGFFESRKGIAWATTAPATSTLDSDVLHITGYMDLSGVEKTIVATEKSVYLYNGMAFTSLNPPATTFASTYEHRWTSTAWPDRFIITNIVNGAWKWSGSGALALLGGASNYEPLQDRHYARIALPFADRLLLFNTIEGGNPCPQRVRWSELGKTEEWAVADGGGFMDLVKTNESILNAMPFGDGILIYKATSIIYLYHTGSATNPFGVRTLVSGIGLYAPWSLQYIPGRGHAFLGVDDIYLYQGGSLPVPFGGSKVKSMIAGEYDRTKSNAVVAFLHPVMNLYVLAVPSLAVDVAYAHRLFVYDYLRDTWAYHYIDGITAGGYVNASHDWTWDDFAPVETPPEITGITAYNDGNPALGDLTIPDHSFDDPFWYSGAKMCLVGNQRAYVGMLFSGSTDFNQGIGLSTWFSKVFTGSPDYTNLYKRCLRISFEARGESVDVYVSENRFSSTTLFGTASLTGNWRRYELNGDFTARSFQLCFRQSAAAKSFAVRSIEIEYVPRSRVE